MGSCQYTLSCKVILFSSCFNYFHLLIFFGTEHSLDYMLPKNHLTRIWSRSCWQRVADSEHITTVLLSMWMWLMIGINVVTMHCRYWDKCVLPGKAGECASLGWKQCWTTTGTISALACHAVSYKRSLLSTSVCGCVRLFVRSTACAI